MSKLTEQQEKMVDRVRKKAEEALQVCKKVEDGAITGEDFEKRASTSLTIYWE